VPDMPVSFSAPSWFFRFFTFFGLSLLRIFYSGSSSPPLLSLLFFLLTYSSSSYGIPHHILHQATYN